MLINNVKDTKVRSFGYDSKERKGPADEDGIQPVDNFCRVSIHYEVKGKKVPAWIRDLLPGIEEVMLACAAHETPLALKASGPMPDMAGLRFCEPSDKKKIVWEMSRAKITTPSVTINKAGNGTLKFSVVGPLSKDHRKAADGRSGGCDGFISSGWTKGDGQTEHPDQLPLGGEKPPDNGAGAPA